MPYFCHIHNGLYVTVEGKEGCQHDKCEEFRSIEGAAPVIVFGAVPGGTRPASVAKAHAKKFDEDMHSYREAHRSGLRPRQVSKKAVEEADKIANGAINEHDILASKKLPV